MSLQHATVSKRLTLDGATPGKNHHGTLGDLAPRLVRARGWDGLTAGDAGAVDRDFFELHEPLRPVSRIERQLITGGGRETTASRPRFPGPVGVNPRSHAAMPARGPASGRARRMLTAIALVAGIFSGAMAVGTPPASAAPAAGPLCEGWSGCRRLPVHNPQLPECDVYPVSPQDTGSSGTECTNYVAWVESPLS